MTENGNCIDFSETVVDDFAQVDAVPEGQSNVHSEHLQKILGAESGLTDGIEDEAGTAGG